MIEDGKHGTAAQANHGDLVQLMGQCHCTIRLEGFRDDEVKLFFLLEDLIDSIIVQDEVTGGVAPSSNVLGAKENVPVTRFFVVLEYMRGKEREVRNFFYCLLPDHLTFKSRVLVKAGAPLKRCSW